MNEEDDGEKAFIVVTFPARVNTEEKTVFIGAGEIGTELRTSVGVFSGLIVARAPAFIGLWGLK